MKNPLRHLREERFVRCPFSIAEDYIGEYLERAERGGAEAVLHVGPLGRRVRLSFGRRSDPGERGRHHDQLVMNWTSGSPLLPDFHGTIAFRIAAPDTRVIVEGAYRPPFGWAGRLFDAFAGRHIATRTVRDLVDHLAADAETRERAWDAHARTTAASP